MKAIEMPAVVLRRWPFSETSMVLRALTPERGVLPLFAKGVHRPTSGRLGVLDTWALVEVSFGGREDADLYTLYDARLLDRFRGLGTSSGRLVAAALVAELAEAAAPTGAPAWPVFRWLVSSLENLHQGAPLPAFLCVALMEALGLLGLAPDLGEGADGEGGWFSPSWGGLLPDPTRGGAGDARRVSPAQLRLLRSLRDGGTAAAEADGEDREVVFTILEEFLLYHLERRPRSLEVLRRRHPLLASLK